MERLVVENISVDYSNKNKVVEALKEVSFSASDKDIIVILGESGSGKTTLLKVVAGLIDYKSGSITISGIDAQFLSVPNRSISFVFQSNNTYPFLSIYNNIALPLKAQKIGVNEIEKRVLEVSNKLDIGFLLSRKPKELSLGQCQKVAIAKALIKRPDIYFFDEPFASIDQAQRLELKKELKKIHDEYNQLMIIVTHDINDALFLATKILVIKDGSIVFSGNSDELIKSNDEYVKSFILNREDND